jgi:hypothetical protein
MFHFQDFIESFRAHIENIDLMLHFKNECLVNILWIQIHPYNHCRKTDFRKK